MKMRVSCSFSSDLEPKTLSLPMRRNAAWCGRKEGREPHAGHEAPTLREERAECGPLPDGVRHFENWEIHCDHNKSDHNS